MEDSQYSVQTAALQQFWCLCRVKALQGRTSHAASSCRPRADAA